SRRVRVRPDRSIRRNTNREEGDSLATQGKEPKSKRVRETSLGSRERVGSLPLGAVGGAEPSLVRERAGEGEAQPGSEAQGAGTEVPGLPEGHPGLEEEAARAWGIAALLVVMFVVAVLLALNRSPIIEHISKPTPVFATVTASPGATPTINVYV